MMLDRLYRALLLLLPREFDGVDREEMWATYRARVASAERAEGARDASRERVRELIDLLRAVARSLSPLPSLESLRQDAHFGIRSLVGAPMTSGLAIASLALGIGATTAIFSALDVWLIRPLPLPNGERLVAVGMANRERGWNHNALSVRDYADWARETESVTLAAYAGASFNLAVGDVAERVDALAVTANVLDVLGIDPRMGRGFTSDDGRPDAPRVAVISDAFWQSSLGADPSAVGTTLVLDGLPHTVVGVLPAKQGIPGNTADVWRPMRISGSEAREGHSLWGIALLAEGTGLSAAREELEAIAGRVVLQDPEGIFPNASVRPFREAIYGREFEQGGLVLAVGVLFVLLIACANIANILLARGLARTHEIAVRCALGAGRGRILQQLLVESLLIAVAGGVVGIAVGHVGLDLLLRYALPPENVPGWDAISLNGRMLAAAGLLTVASALTFGLLPAVRGSRVDQHEGLTEGGRDGGQGGRSRLGSVLVVAEISASLALVALAGLMIRSMVELRAVDLGMRMENALVFRLDVAPASQASSEDLGLFYQSFGERLSALPGVRGVAATSGHFLSQWSTTLYSIPGIASQDDRSRLSAEYRRVTATYRDVLELEMLAGRWFDANGDGPDAPPVTVVSRVLAERWWQDPADALGQVLRQGGVDRLIVGVAEGGRLRGPSGSPPPIIFTPFAEGPSRYTFWIAGYTTDAQEVAGQVRALVHEMDPNLAVFGMQTVEQMFDESLGPQQAAFRILAGLGGLALTLMLVGVYGVLSHSVGRRTHEMGLRMALGAHGGGLVRLVLAGNAKLAAIGIGIGVLISMGAGQGLSFMLAGVSPRDPTVLVLVSALLFGAIFAASVVPALRAARVDPVRSLRGD